MMDRRRPWASLPPLLADVLEPVLPALAEETISAIRTEIPEYDRPLQGSFGRGVRRGVADALADFLTLVRDARARPAIGRSTYRELGAGEWRQGRSLDALQAAYRVGARVAWRRVADATAAAGEDTQTLRDLGEAIFAYIDELAAESVAGYAEEQSRAAGERETRRRELALLVLRGGADEAALARLARAAAWPVPRTLAVLVARDAAGAQAARRRIGEGALDDGERRLVIPDPRSRALAGPLAAALAAGDLALGPVGAPEDAPRSARLAEDTLTLLVPGTSARAEDRLVELALARAEEPIAVLAVRRLAPLDPLSPLKRGRLEATLLAWLRLGSAPRVAAELGVHPQTVRYRLAALRERLGDAALDDPDARFELQLALRRRAAEAGAPA